MLKLGFQGPNRKVLRFEIEGKVVKYFDDLWKEGIQWYPLDEIIIAKMKISRNMNMRILAALILDANKGQDLEEYNACTTEEEIANIIRRDCVKQGLLEIK